jgi:hypothetical protein
MNEEENKKYYSLFTKNKDMNERISMGKVYNLLVTAKVPQDVGQKVLTMIPLSENTSMNFNEFKVVFHIVFKYLTSGVVPPTLPPSLKAIFQQGAPEKKVSGNELDFGFSGVNRGSTGFGGPQVSNSMPTMTTTIPTTTIPQQSGSPHNLGQPQVNVSSNINPMMSNMDLKPTMMNNNLNPNMNNMLINQNNNLNNTQVNQSKSELLENSMNEFNISTIPKKENIDFKDLRNNISEKFNNVYTQSIQDNQFLHKTLEDDNHSLTELLADLEKINKNIQNMNDKNKILREQILEVRKRINQEKDNIAKVQMTMNQKSNELMQNADDLVKVNKEYSDLVNENRFASGRGVQQPQPIQPPQSLSPIRVPKPNNPVVPPLNTQSNSTSPFMPPVGSNFAFNNPNFNPSITFGPTPGGVSTMSSGGVDSTPSQSDKFLAQFNSGNNKPLDNFNRSFDQNKNLSHVPEEPKHEIVYPGLESVQKHSSDNAFVFGNVETHQPKHEPKPTNDFDFGGFPEVKTDPFFNTQKNDDIFKSSNKFDNNPDWDF